MASATATPSVTWAQRPTFVFVTINVSDVTDPDIKVSCFPVLTPKNLITELQVEKDLLYFKGTASADKKVYEVTIKLFKEIDPEKTKYQVRPRCVEFALEKVGVWCY